MLTKTVFAWIFCPPAGAALQFTVVQQANDRVNDARNNLNNAVGNTIARNQDVVAARIRQAEAQNRLMEITHALNTMPSLISVADATRARCEELRTPIIALKKRQDELAGLLSDMQNTASTTKLDTRKKALASAILKVICMGLIDMTLITPAKAVQDELSNNDDEKKSVTVELAEQLKELEATEAAISTAQLHLSSA
jgi:phage tail tube protein FII